MMTFFFSLSPILAIIVLGYLLQISNFLPDEIWAGLEKLTYWVLFPALLLHGLGRQSLAGVPWPSMMLIAGSTLLISAAVLVLWHKMRSDVSGPTFTSIFQGGIRWNTYIALAAALAFYGQEGLAHAMVAAGFIIVLVNVLCVSAFAIWGGTGYSGGAAFIKDVFANPLIIGCAAGWFLSLSGIGLSGPPEEILRILGSAALPLGLMAVGAALRPKAIPGHVKAIVISSLVTFGLKPLTAIFLISAVGLSGIPAGVMLFCFITPTAPTAYILARQLGGDTETMSSIISFQTILAFLMMPAITFLVL